MLPPSRRAFTVTTAAPHQMITKTEAKTSDFCSYGANHESKVASIKHSMSGPHRSQFFSVSMLALRGLSTHIILFPTIVRSRMIVCETGSSSVPRSGPMPDIGAPEEMLPMGALKSAISIRKSAATLARSNHQGTYPERLLRLNRTTAAFDAAAAKLRRARRSGEAGAMAGFGACSAGQPAVRVRAAVGGGV
eukprot:2436757-Pleurochrysis_carterae.AAC.5